VGEVLKHKRSKKREEFEKRKRGKGNEGQKHFVLPILKVCRQIPHVLLVEAKTSSKEYLNKYFIPYTKHTGKGKGKVIPIQAVEALRVARG
jgi:hypothetical protein